MTATSEALTAQATADLLVAEAKLLVERGEAPNLPAGVVRAGLNLELAQTRVIDRAKMLALDSIGALPRATDVARERRTLRAVGDALRGGR